MIIQVFGLVIYFFTTLGAHDHPREIDVIAVIAFPVDIVVDFTGPLDRRRRQGLVYPCEFPPLFGTVTIP